MQAFSRVVLEACLLAALCFFVFVSKETTPGLSLGAAVSEQELQEIVLANAEETYRLIGQTSNGPDATTAINQAGSFATNWTLEPGSETIDPHILAPLLQSLFKTQLVKAQTSQDLETLGLSPALLSLTLRSSEGTKTVRIGKLNTYLGRHYATASGEVGVFLVDKSLADAVQTAIQALQHPSLPLSKETVRPTAEELE